MEFQNEKPEAAKEWRPEYSKYAQLGQDSSPQEPRIESPVPPEESEITIGEYHFSLSESQKHVVDKEVGERRDRIAEETRALAELSEMVSPYKTDHNRLVVDPVSIIDRASADLSITLDSRVEEYLRSPMGASDRKLVEFRRALDDPDSLPTGRREEIAKELDVPLGGIRARVQSKHAQTQELRLDSVIRYQIRSITDSDDKQAVKAEASLAVDRFAEPLANAAQIPLSKLKDVAQAAETDNPSQLVEHIKAYEKALSDGVESLSALFEDTELDKLAPILTGLARGYVTKEELLQGLRKHYTRPHDMAATVIRTAMEVRRATLNLFEDPSLRGIILEPQDIQAAHSIDDQLRRIAEATGRPVGSDIADRVSKAHFINQSKLPEYIDEGNTPYIHFTPQANAIFESQALRPGAHESVINTTGAHSRGVHWAKFGAGYEDAVAVYAKYSRATTLENLARPPRDPMGIAVVYPLERIAAVSPLRNERKILSPTGAHAASDATFRDTDGGLDHEYPLEYGYIVPLYSRDQVPFEEDKNGDRIIKPYAEPIKDALRRAGHYDEAWIEAHVIDSIEPYIDGVFGGTAYIELAVDEAQRRMSTQNPRPNLLVPATTRGGSWETLDGRGNVGAPVIEHLIEIPADARQ
ncbi:MAG: helix-turn-helix protein [Patescibacteria group bacterium]|nr:helix-turn-helix protein [Patescibacteria group bacterium]